MQDVISMQTVFACCVCFVCVFMLCYGSIRVKQATEVGGHLVVDNNEMMPQCLYCPGNDAKIIDVKHFACCSWLHSCAVQLQVGCPNGLRDPRMSISIDRFVETLTQ